MRQPTPVEQTAATATVHAIPTASPVANLSGSSLIDSTVEVTKLAVALPIDDAADLAFEAALGMPVAWCLANPKIGEREVAQELLGHARERAALRDDMIVLTDKGLSGTEMEHFAADQIGVLLVRPDRKDEKRRYGNLAGIRQWIESVNDTLKGQLDLEHHGGRTPQPVSTPASPNASSRWPPRSGTTGPPTPPSNAH